MKIRIKEGLPGTQYLAVFSTAIHARQQLSAGFGSYGFLIFHLRMVASVVLTLQPPLPLELMLPLELSGEKNDTALKERTALIKLLQYAAARNRCSLIRIYTIASVLTAVLDSTSFLS